jgi:dTDP-4-dehydrorhamnose 3,5-epimerase
MPFTFTPASLPGVLIIESTVFADDRGFFMETFKKSAFLARGLGVEFVQENHSTSIRGTLRGLHLQHPPRAQGKLVRVTAGEIFDVAADIRTGSPTFGKWTATVLSEDNRRSLYVPEGYAHGFCVMSAEAQVVYKTTSEYAPELEWGVRWDDPVLAIPWPITNPILSPRDSRWPGLENVPG